MAQDYYAVLVTPCSQSEAEAGANNSKPMTPLRTKQAVYATLEAAESQLMVGDGDQIATGIIDVDAPVEIPRWLAYRSVHGSMFIGKNAGGAGAGGILADGFGNTIIGHDAGVAMNAGGVGDNTCVGANNFLSLTIGGYNTAIGVDSQVLLTTGDGNTSLGKVALYTNSTGNSNVAIGRNALYAHTISEGTALGTNAGRYNVTGTFPTYVGSFAGYNQTGNQNVAIGATALRGGAGAGTATGGADNTAIGISAGYAATSGSENIFIGSQCAVAQTTASGNTAIGYAALGTNVTGESNLAIGRKALWRSTGSRNLAIGESTLQAASNTGADNIAIGEQAGFAVTSGIYNLFVGGSSGSATTTGQYNIAIGYQALTSNVGGNNNVAIGYRSIYTSSAGLDNVAIGKFACTTITGNQNVGIGSSALQSATNTGADNTAIGTTAGFAVTSGSRNTLIGSNVATALTTGNNNVIIGYNIDLPAASSANMLDIGNLIYATGINSTTGATVSTTGRVGIKETSPDYVLDVNGDFGFTPGASVTPADNGDVVFEFTNNTTLTIKAKGSDGTVRSGTVTLS